jgi:hypothetical protein
MNKSQNMSVWLNKNGFGPTFFVIVCSVWLPGTRHRQQSLTTPAVDWLDSLASMRQVYPGYLN